MTDEERKSLAKAKAVVDLDLGYYDDPKSIEGSRALQGMRRELSVQLQQSTPITILPESREVKKPQTSSCGVSVSV